VEERRKRRERGNTGRMRDVFQPTFFLLSLFSSDEKIGTTYPPPPRRCAKEKERSFREKRTSL
jgi:hypothetical protein